MIRRIVIRLDQDWSWPKLWKPVQNSVIALMIDWIFRIGPFQIILLKSPEWSE